MLSYRESKNVIVKKKPIKNIRFMTYNVHGFKDINFKKTFEMILDNIQAIKADILVLEEVYVFKKTETNVKCLVQELKDRKFKYFCQSACGINLVCSRFVMHSEELDLGKDPIR